MSALADSLMQAYRDSASVRSRVYPSGEIAYDEYYPSSAKTIIGQIDAELAHLFGFTDEELDFIINYGYKYRMGGEGISLGRQLDVSRPATRAEITELIEAVSEKLERRARQKALPGFG